MGRIGDLIRQAHGVPLKEPEDNRTPEEIEAAIKNAKDYRNKVFSEKPQTEFLSRNSFDEIISKTSIELYGKGYSFKKVMNYADLMMCYCLAYKDWNKAFSEMIINEGGLDKGILFIGNVGCGKTSLFKIFSHTCNRNNLRNPIKGHLVSANTIVSEFVSGDGGGYDALDKYIEHDLIIDDIGTEQIGSSYGNKVETIGYLIEQRHHKFVQSGLKTHGSTNLTPEQIEKKYGHRVRSRIREMFNVIYFDGTDLRK